MKTGKNLIELATEIERRANAKKDFVASTTTMRMAFEEGMKAPAMTFGDHAFGINGIAHDQIGAHTEIPGKYYDKMLADAPDLLATNVNRWFTKYPAVRMARTLDGTLRAFPSDKYRPLEDEDLAGAALPAIMDLGLEVISSEITERRLYIKCVDKRVVRELAKAGARFGDGGHTIVRIASPAMIISNSEVCCGALEIKGGYYDGFCSNQAWFGERSMRKTHVGGKHELVGEDLYRMLSDETRRKTDAALWAQVGDVIRGVFDRVQFDALIDKVEGAREDKLGTDTVKTIELSSRRLGLNEVEGKSVLQHLIEGADLSRFGLMNAITRAAQDIESYDRSTELERIGAQVIELPKAAWQEMQVAA